MKRVLLIFLSLGFFPSPLVLAQKSKVSLEEQIQKTLRQTIIPKFELHDVQFPEALEFLRTEIRRHDPKGRGVTFIVQVEPPSPGSATTEPAVIANIPGLVVSSPEEASAPSGLEAKTAVTLSNIPAIEALNYLTALASLKYRIEADGVHIVHPSAPAPMFTRDFRIRPDVIPLVPGGRVSPKSYLMTNGVLFPEGSAAILTDDVTRFTVHSTKEQFDLVEAILNEQKPRKPESLEEAGRNFLRRRQPLEDRRRELEKTILPRVSFEDVPLSEAVKTLNIRYHQVEQTKQTKSPRVRIGLYPPIFESSATEPEPDNAPPKGVESIAGLSPAPPPPPAEKKIDPDPKITYSAVKVSLWNVLQDLARLTQRTVRVTPSAACLADPGFYQDLTSKEWVILPSMIPKIQKIKLSRTSPQLDEKAAREWLVSSGVAFDGAPAIVHIPKTNRLIMKDTPASVEAAEEMVAEAWRAYFSEKAAKK